MFPDFCIVGEINTFDTMLDTEIWSFNNQHMSWSSEREYNYKHELRLHTIYTYILKSTKNFNPWNEVAVLDARFLRSLKVKFMEII